MATFIDDILVATDIEGHNELVEEVLKRLEKNDLFVKPEKCKWKVREVEFLGVVIGPKGVEMQRKKGERNIKLAGTQKCQRGTKVFRPCQLLQKVYKRLCQDSCTATCTSQKGAKMEVREGTGEGIQET